MGFKKRTRNFNSSSYLGSGSDNSVLNRRPKKAFQYIRQVYDENLIGETGILDRTAYGRMSQTEKEKMRYRVRSIIERQKRRQFYSYLWFGMTCLVGFLIVVAIMNSTK